ncbi:MAG: toprim domain-containing protein, partial [Thermoleophilia bacterium]
MVAALKARGSKPANEREETWTCPAHRDSTASMSLSEGGDGRALIHCHAGCESDAILDALGLTRRDLFADVPRSDTGAIHYVYTDADGHPLCRVTRLPGKDFRQSRYAPADPDANADGYLNRRGCMKDVQRVLYRLPAVAAAVAAGETIYVTEGEKDADALTRAGVVATTAPQGAGKWHRVDATPLAGAEVVIVADRDQEGRKHAEQVRADLVGRGCRVRVVEAAEGKDAHDHLAAGLGIEDFTDVTAGAP